MKEIKIVIYNESDFSSYKSDIFSFLILFGGLLFNYKFLGDSLFIKIFFVIVLLITFIPRSAKKIRGKKDLKEFLKDNPELYENQSQRS